MTRRSRIFVALGALGLLAAGTAARLLRADDASRARQFLDCNRDLLLYRHALRIEARLIRHGIARRLAGRAREQAKHGGRG